MIASIKSQGKRDLPVHLTQAPFTWGLGIGHCAILCILLKPIVLSLSAS